VRIIFSFGYGINTNQINQFICTFGTYSIYCVTVISAYLLCLFSFDRMVSIVFINKFGFMKKKWFQIGAIAAIVAYSLIAYIGFPIFFELRTNIRTINQTLDFVDEWGNSTIIQVTRTEQTRSCAPTRVDRVILLNVYFGYDLFNAAVVPFTLMIAFSSISIFKIYKSRANASSSSQQQHSSSSNKKSKLKSRDINFAIVSITLNLVFLILNMPIAVYIIIWNIDPLISPIYDIITRILYYSSFGSMFFVNILTNSLFKRELTTLFLPQSLQKRNLAITRGDLTGSSLQLSTAMNSTLHVN
jgi:hypothetical protein